MGIERRDGHVVEDASPTHQANRLQRAGETELCPFVRRRPCDVHTIDQDLPVVWAVATRDELEQRRLSRTVRPADGVNAKPADRELTSSTATTPPNRLVRCRHSSRAGSLASGAIEGSLCAIDRSPMRRYACWHF